MQYGAYEPGTTLTMTEGMPDIFSDPPANEWRALKASVRFRVRQKQLQVLDFTDRVVLAFYILTGRI
jgi:hypothetical protein